MIPFSDELITVIPVKGHHYHMAIDASSSGINLLKIIGIIILAIIIIIIVFIIAIIWYFEYQFAGDYPKYRFSSDTYTLRISDVSTNLTNVTLLIPLPAINGTSYLHNEPVSANFYNKTAPTGFNFSITSYQGRPMLQIWSDKWCQGGEYKSDDHNPSHSRILNTRYPIGNEELFIPTSYRKSIGYPSLTEDTTPYNIPVYSHFSHEEGNDASLSISSKIEYHNEWNCIFDAYVSNDCTDSYSVILHGNGTWENATGLLISGKGRYPKEPFKNKGLITPPGNTGGGLHVYCYYPW